MLRWGSVWTISKRRDSFLAFLDTFIWTPFLLSLSPVFQASFRASCVLPSVLSFWLHVVHPDFLTLILSILPNFFRAYSTSYWASFPPSFFSFSSFLQSILSFELPSKFMCLQTSFWTSFLPSSLSKLVFSFLNFFSHFLLYILFSFQGSFLPNTISKSDHCPEPMANVKCYKLKMLPTFVMTKLNPALLQHY